MSAAASGEAAVTTSARTICFGRHILELPEGAEIQQMGQQAHFMFGDIQSERVTMDAKAFEQRMAKREAEIRTGALGRRYRLTKALAPAADTRVFVASRTAYGDTAYALDAYRLVGGDILFFLSDRAFDPDKIDDILSRLQGSILPALRARAPDEIPAESGFCLKDGFIAEDGKRTEFQHERAEINLTFKQWPDVSLRVYSWTVHKEGEKSLLQRIKDGPVPAVFANLLGQVRTLRQGRHDVHGRTGEEVLEVLPADGGVRVHSFAWEAKGVLHDPLQPDLYLELRTGRGRGEDPYVRPSLSDEQAVKLFDAIVNSIRLRPTGGPPQAGAADAPPKAPLGALAATGRACPQTGLWQAEEGERRFLQEEEKMPRTEVAGTPTLFDRLRGRRRITSVATLWKLVAYERDLGVDSKSPAGDGPPRPPTA